jgi:hypothetical protein
VKALCQKLIKIDILLSHVRLYKMSVSTRSSEEKKVLKKMGKKIGKILNLEGKTDQNQEKRKPIF